jgi:hypothetical protein
MKTAVRPDFYSNFPSLKRDEEAQKKGATQEERNLYHMSETSGWRLFQGYMQTLLGELDLVNEAAIAGGASKEQIGENAIINSYVRGLITRLMNRVADAKEACTNEGSGT